MFSFFIVLKMNSIHIVSCFTLYGLNESILFISIENKKSICYVFWIHPIYWKSSLKLVQNVYSNVNSNSKMVLIYGFRKSAEIFTTIVSGWKLLGIVIKSSSLDIGRVSGSIAGRKWNAGLDLKLKFTMKKDRQHQLLEKVITD